MTRFDSLTDAELVHRCKEGDAEAWNALVDRFSRYVSTICLRGFRLREADAEDVFQDVFTRVYTNLHTLRDESAVRPWIAQLTRRLCLDTLSSGAREQPEAEPIAADREARLDEIDEAFAVREALGHLSDTCQDMLDRFFAQDQSYRTISAELDLPSGTIASRIARCLGKLRVELEGRTDPSGRSRE